MDTGACTDTYTHDHGSLESFFSLLLIGGGGNVLVAAGGEST